MQKDQENSLIWTHAKTLNILRPSVYSDMSVCVLHVTSIAEALFPCSGLELYNLATILKPLRGKVKNNWTSHRNVAMFC